MDAFLIRHAAAVPRSPELDDAARPLTSRGRRRWAHAVRGLEKLGVSFDCLHHSPWLRALETADALMPLVDGESVVDPHLAAPPGRELLENLSGERLALVGHEPWLSELLALLALGSAEQGPRFLLKKGGVAWLKGELRPGGMQLCALFLPKALRAIGR